MRHKSYLALFICLLMLSCDDAIDPNTSGKFIKFYGGTLNEIAYAVEELPDKGFIIVGATESYGHGEKNVLVIRTDQNGNRKQEGGFDRGLITFNDTMPGEGRSVLVDENGNLLVFGYTTKNNNKDFLLLSIKADGTTTEQFVYGDPSKNEEGYFIYPPKEGGYLLIGNIQDKSNTDTQMGSVHLVKTKANLEEQYKRNYGLFGEPDSTGNIVEDDNGNIVWCGTVGRGDSTLARVVISDAFGNLITDKQYDDSLKSTSVLGKDIIKVNGGFAMIGTVIEKTANSNTDNDANIYLVNLNTDASKSQDTIITLENKQYARSIYPTNDGNFIITGKTIFNDKSDVLLLKITRQGEVLWKKTFGGAGTDEGTFVKQTSDGGYIILATIEIQNNTAIALIKTDAEGNSFGSLARE